MEENISRNEILEKIAELEYSQSHLRDLNAEMRHWLDVADDDMAALRSENASLRKQVKELEKIISEAQQVEAEPYGYLLACDLDENRSSDKMIQALEMESTMAKEENKKLTTKLKNLEEEIEQEKITSSRLRAVYQRLENEVEEAQLELHRRHEVIHQKTLQVTHLEETVEEYNNIIKDLRLTKLELNKQLEDRRDEASLAVLDDVTREEEGSVNLHLSLAEEIQMLVSSAERKTGEMCSADFTPATSEEGKHKGTEADELLEPQSPTENCQTKSGGGGSARTPGAAAYRARLLVLCVFALFVLILTVLGCCAGDLFPVRALRSSARLMLQPYFGVHYDALPPI
ncbi:coiled-coil domain-containing protein 14-like [Kryptolebias marmoratus]|uniref:coiled-coil domain-containing protein 14-like n=1 Tax=Kryptolebias marmoratus TaxID=37003 RepID=UPI000D52FF23|nr:coiled-coil domain-containing protein 14-like [Kryptolebias marmoratus]